MRTYWLNGVTNSEENTLNQEVKVKTNSLNSSKTSFAKNSNYNTKILFQILLATSLILSVLLTTNRTRFVRKSKNLNVPFFGC